MSAVQVLLWVMWFLACLTRIRWIICCVCVIGIIVNGYYVVGKNKQKGRTSCWIAIVFFSVVVIGNVVFVTTR